MPIASPAPTLPEALAIANPGRRQELDARFVAAIETADREVVEVIWRPEVRPFLGSALRGHVRPRTDSNPQQQRSVLDWYLEVG